MFGWVGGSEGTVVCLPLLIDGRSIEFTDACIMDLLRMMHDLSKKAYQNFFLVTKFSAKLKLN